MSKRFRLNNVRVTSKFLAGLIDHRGDLFLRNKIMILSILVGSFFLSAISSWRLVGYPIWHHLLSDQGIFDDFYGVRDENPDDYYLQDPYYGANPPGTMILGRIYALFPARAAIVIFVSFYLLSSSLIVMFVTKRKSSLIFMLISYPFWVGIFRGNDDMYLFPLTMLLLWSFAREKLFSVGIIVGLMSTLEPYFILFAFPSVLKGSNAWKTIIPAISVSFMSWISMVFIGSRDLSLYLSLAQSSPKTYLRDMAFGDGGMLFGNSLFGLLKFLATLWYADSGTEVFQFAENLHTPYVLIAFVTVVVVLMRLLYRTNSTSSIFSVLAMLLILLPHVAASYKLVVISAILIFQLFQEGSELIFVRLRLFLMAVVVIPKPFPKFSMPSGVPVFLDSIVNPILMIICLLVTVLTNDDNLNQRTRLKPLFGNHNEASA